MKHNMKKCSCCKKILDIGNFYKDISSPDSISYKCKVCDKLSKQAESYKKYKRKADKSYREKNIKKIKNKSKKYAEKNKERIKEYKKQWYLKNKSKVISRVTKRHKERLHSDINYRLSVYLRCRLNSALRHKTSRKSGSFVRDLGSSIEELKQHLEAQFQPGMTWENHGEWHIDHIKPLASFNLSDRAQFLEACHFTNLQPLWAEDNIMKGVNTPIIK